MVAVDRCLQGPGPLQFCSGRDETDKLPHGVFLQDIDHSADGGNLNVIDYQVAAGFDMGIEKIEFHVRERVAMRTIQQHTIILAVVLIPGKCFLGRAKFPSYPFPYAHF